MDFKDFWTHPAPEQNHFEITPLDRGDLTRQNLNFHLIPVLCSGIKQALKFLQLNYGNIYLEIGNITSSSTLQRPYGLFKVERDLAASAPLAILRASERVNPKAHI